MPLAIVDLHAALDHTTPSLSAFASARHSWSVGRGRPSGRTSSGGDLGWSCAREPGRGHCWPWSRRSPWIAFDGRCSCGLAWLPETELVGGRGWLGRCLRRWFEFSSGRSRRAGAVVDNSRAWPSFGGHRPSCFENETRVSRMASSANDSIEVGHWS